MLFLKTLQIYRLFGYVVLLCANFFQKKYVVEYICL